MPLNENTESKHLDFPEEASLSEFVSLSAIVFIRYMQSVVFGCWGFLTSNQINLGKRYQKNSNRNQIQEGFVLFYCKLYEERNSH